MDMRTYDYGLEQEVELHPELDPLRGAGMLELIETERHSLDIDPDRGQPHYCMVCGELDCVCLEDPIDEAQAVIQDSRQAYIWNTCLECGNSYDHCHCIPF